MQQERREAQSVAKAAATPYQLGLEQREAPKPALIAHWVRNRPEQKLHNLMQFFSVNNLRSAYRRIPGSKAVGHDGITKQQYGEALEENLRTLNSKMRQMAYRPGDARQILIPKPDGRKRPIAICNFEDKLVQKVMTDVLSVIYDRDFKRFSFGFRQGKSCHNAIAFLYNKLKNRNHSWIVDVDLKNFFNTIDHNQLLDFLRFRIGDKLLIRYVYRMLRAGILIEGEYQEVTEGTPQGSIVSPILANIYLHYVLDEWFESHIHPELGGEIVRYADDFVVAFASQEQANEFVKRLQTRVEAFGLSLNMDKTRIIQFNRNSPDKGAFDFLGFTFYWGQVGRKNRVQLKVKTSMKAFKRKVEDFTHWIKANRSRFRLNILWEQINQKLRGHYNYYGVLWNQVKLNHFYQEVRQLAFRWINRRSQKTSYTWEGFLMRLQSVPLLRPMETYRLLDLNNPRLYCV